MPTKKPKANISRHSKSINKKQASNKPFGKHTHANLHIGLDDVYVKYIDLRFEKQKILKDSLDKAKQLDELKKGL